MSSDFEPRIVAFSCGFCGYRGADLAGLVGSTVPASVKVIQVPCSGRVDILHLMKAFEDGADGVFVAGCLEGNCHYLTGSQKAEKRVGEVKRFLGEVGVNPGRVEMYKLSMADAAVFSSVASQIAGRIESLGACPIRTGQGKEWTSEEAA